MNGIWQDVFAAHARGGADRTWLSGARAAGQFEGMGGYGTVLRRAIERRQLRPDTDIDLVIDVIGGATMFRLLQRHAPLSKQFTNDLVDLVLAGCRMKGTRK